MPRNIWWCSKKYGGQVRALALLVVIGVPLGFCVWNASHWFKERNKGVEFLDVTRQPDRSIPIERRNFGGAEGAIKHRDAVRRPVAEVAGGSTPKGHESFRVSVVNRNAEPVFGAQVELLQEGAVPRVPNELYTSDASGEVEIGVAKAESVFRLTVQHPHYADYQAFVRPSELQHVAILKRQEILKVLCLDSESRQGIEGAVCAIKNSDDLGGERVEEGPVRSDSQGVAHVNVPTGSPYILKVSCGGYENAAIASQEMILDEGGTLYFELRGCSKKRIRFVDLSGAPFQDSKFVSPVAANDKQTKLGSDGELWLCSSKETVSGHLSGKGHLDYSVQLKRLREAGSLEVRLPRFGGLLGNAPGIRRLGVDGVLPKNTSVSARIARGYAPENWEGRGWSVAPIRSRSSVGSLDFESEVVVFESIERWEHVESVKFKDPVTGSVLMESVALEIHPAGKAVILLPTVLTGKFVAEYLPKGGGPRLDWRALSVSEGAVMLNSPMEPNKDGTFRYWHLPKVRIEFVGNSNAVLGEHRYLSGSVFVGGIGPLGEELERKPVELERVVVLGPRGNPIANAVVNYRMPRGRNRLSAKANIRGEVFISATLLKAGDVMASWGNAKSGWNDASSLKKVRGGVRSITMFSISD